MSRVAKSGNPNPQNWATFEVLKVRSYLFLKYEHYHSVEEPDNFHRGGQTETIAHTAFFNVASHCGSSSVS